MKVIPTIKLPSNGRAVRFREATISDCLKYCDLNEAFDESLATEYLNSIQEGEVSDSALWTAQDRRTALWWVFICTSKETSIGYEYQCQHCGEMHLQLVDLIDLDDEATSLNIDPFFDEKMMFNGVERDIRLHPYDGRAMVHMEALRLELSGYRQGSADYIKTEARLKIYEVAHSFDFLPAKKGFFELKPKQEQEKTFEEALSEKFDAITSMSRVNEFPALVASVKAAHEKLQHGLNMTVIDGTAHIISPPMPCEIKTDDKGEAMVTRLLIPFRCSVFVPTV